MKRAIAQLIFGVAQTMGATIGVYFLVTTGASKLTITAAGVTAVVSVTSRVVFGVLWKKPKPLDAGLGKASDVKKSTRIKTIPMVIV